ncbi:MAG: D-2-hydroxyacid dehydrogenase [Spirochaetota bacterium]|nr:MAG: D-2-hydroxyacid dehydrogenase [Spirochaetota bacterium]
MGNKKLKIVVLDGYCLNPGDNPWDDFSALGELKVYDRTDANDVLKRTVGADIIITNKTPVVQEVIEQLPKLKYIGVLATGYNIVDVDAARKLDIPVANVPVYGTNSVAQFVFALILELCHHVGMHNSAVHDGEWTKCPDFSFWNTNLVELYGKTIGIVGFGRIGLRVGELAHAFGMGVMAVDIIQKDPPGYKPFSWVSLEEAFKNADIVSLNCAQTPENEGFVNHKLLSLMKKTAFIVNASRGGLINEKDLAKALDSGTIAGAAIDVVSSEPIKNNNPLLRAKNCIITPHIAWASFESRKRLMSAAADNLSSFLSGNPKNIVN